MPKIKHPTIRGVTRTVAESDLADWLTQGWLTEAPEPTGDPEPAGQPPAETAVDDDTDDPPAAPPRPRAPRTPRSATTRQQ